MAKTILSFKDVLQLFRDTSFTERDKGNKFEKLMKKYLEIEPRFANRFKNIWLWNEFPFRKEFSSGKDTGIDLVTQTTNGDYWAVQCKCYDENARIDKKGVDSFISTSGKSFVNEEMQTVQFTQRLWISTTNNWNTEAENTIKNQNPPITRINLSDLEASSEYINWDDLVNGNKTNLKKKSLLDHQKDALNAFHEYFKTANRGKLIMACGTGKTFTSLKIAEKETNDSGIVLFLVPSIALLGQALREWCAQADKPILPICICSDSTVSKTEDEFTGNTVDLAYPASTNLESIKRQLKQSLFYQDGMTVVFSTYQSIDVIAQAQSEFNRQYSDKLVFDLIICDEAHRTTGVVLKDKKESDFTKVHDNTIIEAKKRMYMTATPRLYSDSVKQKANENDAILCSMDDESIYGPEVYRIGFGQAVSKNLLSDYKVLILALKEKEIPEPLRNIVKSNFSGKEIDSDDIGRLVGCINALSKRVMDIDDTFNDDKKQMKKAVAFCNTIKDSKFIKDMFNTHKDTYYNSLPNTEREKLVGVQSQHIDGTMDASSREKLLDWLKNTPSDTNECHILTNARCLSEGVDVPSLDAVMFLSGKNSQIDVVQSVGRVMRKAEGKKYGYIIIPIMIPNDISPEEALDDNKTYSVIWTVLNALRAHDERFDAEINAIQFGSKKGKGHIHVIGGNTGTTGGTDTENIEKPVQLGLQFEEFKELQSAIFAKMVKKVGSRTYWVKWANDVAKIAQKYIEKINTLIEKDGTPKEEFEKFWNGLKKNINPSISKEEVVQMLSQHLITQPVFEALFDNYSFVKNNPVSNALQNMIEVLKDKSLENDSLNTLHKFYESVKERVSCIDTAEGRQKIIIELYDKFFKTAFPKVVEQLGIVYTPVEVVDFINNSVAQVLKKEFNRNLSDENVHILDPFTGTGTFITRLIQTGLISKEALTRKYEKELHANEIVLLAYYIASINIENAYHDVMGTESGYKSFNGICLTDTFQLGETDKVNELFTDMLPQNSERVMEQKKLPVRVIIGNPPYSIGQKSEDDNAKNQSYPKLDARIANTYVKHSNAVLNRGLYDSYIKAFRWSSDRIDNKNGGIIAFVSNGAWLDNQGMDGFRKCFEQEFSSIYIFNLRGNQRTMGELSRQEGGKIFGSGSRTPISITILVKHPNKSPKEKATIYYNEVADYMSREDKLALVAQYKNILNPKMPFKVLKPNEHGDWLNQRSDLFSSFISIGDKADITKTIFSIYSGGLLTSRDSWCYNFSKNRLANNMKKSIDFYNEQREKYQQSSNGKMDLPVEKIIDIDQTKISWSHNIKHDLEKNKTLDYDDSSAVLSSYRPFTKHYVYFNREWNERVYQQPKLFPTSEQKNICISLSGTGSNKDFSCGITNILPDYGLAGTTQCFPLYYYEKNEGNIGTLFDDGKEQYIRRDGITDFILEQCRSRYQTNKITKEDIFYYVYGLLHSKDYRTQFAADLKKMLPRIPLVDIPNDFLAFSKAGRELAELHLNYETVPAYPDVQVIGEEKGNFHVDKLTFGKKDKELDKTTIIYNSSIKITNIPLEAYNYVINGRSAIEWIMDRYQIKVDKDSGIKNDPNDWGLEHNNPRYILNLILSIITVSIKTNKIIETLPKLEFK